MSARGQQAYRAAGQAVAAVLVGARVDRVSARDGAVVQWKQRSWSAARSDSEILARILIVLTGVGAQKRYSFGAVPDDSVCLMPRPDDEAGLADIELADALSLYLAAPPGPGLAATWAYAAEPVCQSDVWEAIEAVAEALLVGAIDGGEIMSLCFGRRERDQI